MCVCVRVYVLYIMLPWMAQRSMSGGTDEPAAQNMNFLRMLEYAFDEDKYNWIFCVRALPVHLSLMPV